MNTPESDPSRSQPSGLQVELGGRTKRRFRQAWLALTFALVGAAATVWLSAQQSATKIEWSSDQVLEFLQPGEKRRIVVTFRSTQDVASASVTVTPSLASLVSASPRSLTRIRAGRDNRLTLDLTAPSQSAVKFDGTIQIRSDQPAGSTISQPLPVTIVIHNDPVPPDPGDAGKATIEGIDSDGDGVRDDVQRLIVLNHLDSTNATRAALGQYAKSMQRYILAAGVPDVEPADAERRLANDCLEYVLGPSVGAAEAAILKAALLNTQARVKAYATAENAIPGVYFLTNESHLKDGCQFDPDAI